MADKQRGETAYVQTTQPSTAVSATDPSSSNLTNERLPPRMPPGGDGRLETRDGQRVPSRGCLVSFVNHSVFHESLHVKAVFSSPHIPEPHRITHWRFMSQQHHEKGAPLRHASCNCFI